MEHLNALDPIEVIPDDFVMAFRVSLLLRGLSYALRYDHVSHAAEWKTLAQQVIQNDAEERLY